MTFLCIGIFAFVLMIYLMLMLPKVPSRGTFSLQILPFLFRKSVLLNYLLEQDYQENERKGRFLLAINWAHSHERSVSFSC